MKKINAMIAAAVLVMGLAACGSQPAANAPSERRIPSRFPEFVKESLRTAPEDVLVGIGTAKLASLSQSRTVAASRARAEISRQLNTMVQDMIRDYQASSEVDPASALAFQENITVTLSKSTLVGSSVVGEDEDANGNWWTVVMLSKTDVANEINQATAAAKLAVPANASFDAEARMNDAFKRANGEEFRVADK
jgi:GTPase